MFPGFLMDIPDMPENISSLPPNPTAFHPADEFTFIYQVRPEIIYLVFECRESICSD